MQGRIALGEELRLEPAGRDVRVRSLQIFGEKRARVDGGSRVAVNLPGIETNEIARGTVLASAQFATRSSVAVRFRALPLALPLLKRRTPVRAYLGSAEILGTLVFERVPENAEEAQATLHLRAPAVVFPGAAFVVRRLTPKTLLGGGTIASIDAISAASGEATGPVTSDDTAEVAGISATLRAVGLAGATAARVGAAANVREDVATEILERLVDDGRVMRLAKPDAYLDASLAHELSERVRERLEANEGETPWALGVTALALSRALSIAEPTLVRVLTALAEEGKLAHRSGYFATPQFVPHLAPEQRAFFDRVFAPDPNAPYVPVAFDDVLSALRATKIPGLSLALDTLFASGTLVKVHDAIYRGSQIADIRAMLEAALRRDKQIAMSGFRDLIGTSRKYAVPLLEYFDAIGVTIRTGDARVLKIVAPRVRA
jgi:selenocysteine-specific elongation factor